MEHKSSREKAWVASKNKNTKFVSGDNLNNEINNLQDGTFIEMEEVEEEPIPLTEEELLQIRKKIGFLLAFVLIIFVILLFILIFDPFAPKKGKNNDSSGDGEVVGSDVTLYDYEDGTIQIDDPFIYAMYNEIEFKEADDFIFDTYFLFRNKETNISSLTDIEKTILVSKTNDFNDLINNIGSTNTVCDNEIIIDSKKINEIALNKYGVSVNLVSNFKYSFYYYNSLVSNINFVLKDNKYVGTCFKHNNVATKIIKQELYKASKEDDYVYIDVKTAFVNSNGIFLDPDLTKPINYGDASDTHDIMLKANTYRYTYVVSEDGYYLKSVSLLK